MSEFQKNFDIPKKSYKPSKRQIPIRSKPIELYKYKSARTSNPNQTQAIGVLGQIMRLNAIKVDNLTKTQRAYLERSKVYRDIKPDRYATTHNRDTLTSKIHPLAHR